MNKTTRKAVNTLCNYLAMRDIMELSMMKASTGIHKADVTLVLGSDLPYLPEYASGIFKQGLTRYLVFCGGVGHSTMNLKRKVSAIMRQSIEELPDSEAELYAYLALKHYHIPEDVIILEKDSTNTMENIRNAMQILEQQGIRHDSILLLQDPLLQRRSYVTALDLIPEQNTLISYAPFVPSVDEKGTILPVIPYLWEEKRFYELILGEIVRLRDDENGYGPKGTGFLRHVDIPDEVEKAYQISAAEFADYNTRKKVLTK